MANKFFGSTEGLTLKTDAGDAYVSSEFNTGIMPDEIKLATLSDTDATDVTGSELVTNGTFDSDVSGWTAYNAILSRDTSTFTSSSLKIVDDGGKSRAYQQITTEVGKVYTATAYVKVTGSGSNYDGIVIYPTVADATALTNEIARAVAGTANITFNPTVTFTATTTTTTIVFTQYSTTGVTYVDNISVRLAEPDRSVNGNGLQVFGTITKTQVSDGADLVAYSGFSESNYLQQPYNPDLDFGTGDFSLIGWAIFGGAGSYSHILSYGDYGTTSSSGFVLRTASDATEVEFRSDATNAGSQIYRGVPTSGWVNVAVIRSEGTLVFYINGNAVKTVSGYTGNVGSGDTATLIVGYGGNESGAATSQNPWGSSLALWRISATAPTAEQIAKIYEDEKVLFQEGAQATLYGSSDAVTALAYDTDTNLLHVGTSAGRSVFSGLRRVEEHTGADSQSLTAISASNGYVVEGK